MSTKKQQEAVLMDLLRVIGHHRARLATPIRTMQKVRSDADIDNIPFSETIFTHAGSVVNRPLLLIEPPQRINSDDKAKIRTPRPNEEQAPKSTASSEPKPTTVIDGATKSSSEKQLQPRTTTPRPNEEQAPKSTTSSDPKHATVMDGTSQSSSEKQQQLHTTATPRPNEEQALKSTGSSEPKPSAVIDGTTVKNESEKPASSPSVAKPYEGNLVLDVAIEGSKRTLPIEEEEIKPVPLPVEASEMAASRSGNGSSPSTAKDRKGQLPAVDQRGQER